MKKFTFYTKGKGGPKTFTKTENRLTQADINLLTSNIVNEFNKLPEAAKMLFMFYLNQSISDAQTNKILNDLREERTGVSDILKQELEDLTKNEDKEADGIRSDNGGGDERKEPNI